MIKPFLLSRHSFLTFVFTALPFCAFAQNVGIGTNDPQEKLHIINGNLLISPNTSGFGFTHFNPLLKLRGRQPASGDVQGTSFGLDFELNSDLIGSIRSVNGGALGVSPYIRISRSTPTAADLTVSSTGNVGIGTSSPSAKLQVLNGNFRINHTADNALIELQRGGEDRGIIQLSGANGENLRLGTYSGGTGSFIVRTNGGDRLTVNSSGNVAIGGASATHRLNISGNAKLEGNDELLQLNGTGDSRFIQFYKNNAAKAYIQLIGDHLALGNSTGNNAGNLRLNGAQVTVGADTPAAGYKLSVGGRVMCTELRVEVAANWPDYVFGDDYALTPLEKVEDHIQQHKHLPNIPSASRISESGLHLGEMQRLQMEKIEELFLHMIALKKEVEAVRAENEALKAALK